MTGPPTFRLSKFLSLILLLQSFVHISAGHDMDVDVSAYRQVEILDSKGKYQLEWLVEWDKKRVIFNVVAKTNGYVGFGLSRKGKMAGADIVIGGVSPNGTPYFTDHHAEGNQYPVLDRSQDWKLHSVKENKTHTSLSFSRAFDTCDEHDIPINDDALSLLWAYGESDTPATYHFENRGSFNVYLLDPHFAPKSSSIRSPKLSGINDELQTRTTDGSEGIWTLTRRLQIPAKKTTYWCDFHKIELPRKHHITGFEFQVNEASRPNMHHLLLYRCTPPPNVNPVTLYEPFVTHKGQECYTTLNPRGQIGNFPTQYCTDVSYGFAIGGNNDYLPDHVGIPIGRVPNEYYVLQIHYDNPQFRQDIISEIQLKIFYTKNLRKNEGGILSMGHNIPGVPSLLLPRSEINHRILAHCSSPCTEKMFPPEGIKIAGALLHSHNAGRQLKIQHFRNNRELPPILKDDNYIFNFQPLRLLRKDVTVLPGDQLTMRCVYDTTTAAKTTVGGYATEQEMCKTFILYYNRLDDYPICRSQIISPEYSMRYLGVTNVTWDEAQLEFVATSPPQLAGLTMSQISDSTVNWSIALRAELQRDHLIHPQVAICPRFGNNPEQPQLPPELVSFPVQASEYQLPQTCSLKG